jgi:hypothetical protein
MRFLHFGVAVLILASTASGQVISQVYGGGQGGAAVYKNDYVELFNPTASPVSLTNWSIYYQAQALPAIGPERCLCPVPSAPTSTSWCR